MRIDAEEIGRETARALRAGATTKIDAPVEDPSRPGNEPMPGGGGYPGGGGELPPTGPAPGGGTPGGNTAIGAYTQPDAEDGHTHAIASYDGAAGLGVTEVAGGEGTGIHAHAHAIVAGYVQPYSAFGYVSDHGGAFKGADRIAVVHRAVESAFGAGD